jgi:hypothetical protein
MTNGTPRFVDNLRNELVSAAERNIERKRRRHRRSLNTLAVIAVLVLTAGIVQFNAKPSAAEVLDFHRSNGLITVDLTTTNARASQIVDELKKNGIDASIVEVPVSNSGVGKFTALSHGGGSESPVQGTTYFQQFTLADQDNQKLTIWFGRAARTDETYVKFVNAYDPGESLHCSNTLGRTVRDGLNTITERQLSAQWFSFSDSQPLGTNSAGLEDRFIITAVADRPKSVRIYVSPEPVPLVGTATDCA